MKKISKINKENFLMGLLLLSFCLPNIDIIKFGDGTHRLKLYRVVTIFYLIWTFCKKKVKLPSKIITLFLIYMVIHSAISTIFYGIERLIFDYIFAFIILVIVFNCGKNISKNEWINIIKTVATISLITVLFNILFNIKEIINFMKNPYDQHPIYESIYSGGANLDATWIALFSFFFIGDKKGYIYIGLCSIVSILLSSRVGLIINIISFLYLTFSNEKYQSKGKINKDRFILFIFIIIIGLLLMFVTGIADNLINRLTNLISNPGSQGRLAMWKYVGKATINNPFGYGTGNAIKGIKIVSNEWFVEDNVHNLFFQMILDLGIVGFAFYVGIIFVFIKKEFKNIMRDPFVAFLMTYILISIIQFKGAEIVTFYIIGVYLLLRKDENVKGNNIVIDGKRKN